MNTVLYGRIGDQAPEYIRLLPVGEVVLGDGRQPFQVTAESVAKIMEAWKARGNDIVIDYEHQTGAGHEAPAAGWIKELTAAADGLWARVVWTDRAREYIEQREYRYFSPVVQLGEGRVVTDLLHVALTNFPAMRNLAPLVLQHQAGPGGGQEKEFGSGGTMAPGEDGVVREGVVEGGEEVVMEELRKSLGLQEDAPLEAVLQRITALQAEAEAMAVLRGELAGLQKDFLALKAEALVQEALSSKRTTPAELNLAGGRLRKLAHEDPEFFQELILSRQENWAVPGPLSGGEGSRAALSQEERSICETFNIAPEVFMKNRALWQKRG